MRLSAKVIDGYIQGANVYIDFNWNLQQDEGEPSAVDNGNGDYEFPYKNGEFDARNYFCLSDGYKWLQRRPRNGLKLVFCTSSKFYQHLSLHRSFGRG